MNCDEKSICPDHVALYTHPAPAASQAEPKREPSLGELMREQRQSRIVAGAYPDGNPNAGAMMAQTRQAEPSAALIRAHNSGYMQGHQDTVEAQFIVIHPLDMNTYHADVVAELGLTAAPQTEPCIGNDSARPCQDGDACHYKDAADGTKAWPVPQAEPIDPHMIVAEDRFPDVPAERWKPCPQCGEDFDRECPICDGLGKVLATDGEQAEPKRDWTAVDAAIREYLDDYELIGEDDAGADAYYTPTERELYLIYDAINGLFADESFVAAISAPQAEPKREPLSDEQMTRAAQDVLAERRRQIEAEGWTPEHDDEHSLGEMAALAAFYAVPDGVHEWDFSSTGYGATLDKALLPSGWTAKAGKDRRRDLVKAGALILAEIERLDRMGGSDAE